MRISLGREFFSKSTRAALIPTLVIGIPILALLILQFRSLMSFEAATAEMLLHVNARMAERLSNQFQADFRAPLFNVIEKINHRDVIELQLDRILQQLYEERGETQLVDSFFVWSSETDNPKALGETTVGENGRPRGESPEDAEGIPSAVYFVSVKGGQGVQHLDQAAFRTDPVWGALIKEVALVFADLGTIYGIDYRTFRGSRYELVFHLRYDDNFEHKGLRAFFGFTVDTHRLIDVYFPSVVNELRSQRPRFSSAPVPHVSIVNDRGEEVFRSGPSLKDRSAFSTRFPFIFFDIDTIDYLRPLKPGTEIPYWTVSTGYGDATVEELARRQTNTRKLLWSVIALVAVAGVALTARATAREVKLAEMKSDFVTGVSHDLKTPLATIRIFAEMLGSGRVRSAVKIRQYGGIISRHATQLHRIIESVLDFEADRAENDYDSPLDLREPVEAAIDSTAHLLEQREFELVVELPPEAIRIRGDSPALQQAFRNLITNAIKYSTEDCYLAIRLEAREKQACISFMDRGVGIHPRDRDKIFRRFYRAKSSPAGATGAGIGLAIVRHIVEDHGGTVSVESERKKGSTFTIRLPLEDTDQNPSNAR